MAVASRYRFALDLMTGTTRPRFGVEPLENAHIVDEWRRETLKDFHVFGEYLRAGEPGMEEFLNRNAVRIGYESILKTLLYLDIAKGEVDNSDSPADSYTGFLFLGDRWMSGTSLSVPRLSSE